LSDLGKKNYWKLFNPVTGKVEEPPEKRCNGTSCGEWMDWRTTGQMFKQKNGRYTYQQYCQGCRKTDYNNEVCYVCFFPLALERFLFLLSVHRVFLVFIFWDVLGVILMVLLCISTKLHLR
jgi:hypothetical protein